MSTSTATAPVENVETPEVLDACDACGHSSGGERIAQAFVQIKLPSGRKLNFCGHHTEKHMSALIEQRAEIIQDQRDRINVKPSISANSI